MIVFYFIISLSQYSQEYQVSGDGTKLSINTTSEITPDDMTDSGGQENYLEITIFSAPSIASSAFSGCPNLKYINMCDSISSIGPSAFSGCKSLISVTIPFQTTQILRLLFYECKSLINITIHENVNSIESSTCFQGCTSLSNFIVSRSSIYFRTDDLMKCLISNDGLTLYSGTCGTVNIPQKIQILAPYCLYWRGIKSVIFPNNSDLIEIQENVFGLVDIDTLAFPNKLKRIINKQFYQSHINEIVFPDSLESIPNNIFSGIYTINKMTFNNETSKVFLSLNGVIYDREMTTIFLVSQETTSITIPSQAEQISYELVRNHRILSVEVLKGNANMSSFEGVLYDNKTEVLLACPGGMKTVKVAPTCKRFLEGSFVRCLVETVIFEGDAFEEVGGATFDYCFFLTTMELPRSLKHILNFAFESCISWTCDVKLTSNLTQLNLYAFNGCNKLNSVDLSECSAITSLPRKTFCKCGIKWIKFPPQISYISDSCFQGCTQMESIIVPSTVGSIDANAFSGCILLQNVTILSKTINYLSESLFEGSGLTTFDVPDNIQSIESNCFKGCANLTSINFGSESNLNKISPNMIYGCKSLLSIELPSAIATIQLDSLTNAAGLQSILIRSRMCYSDDYWSDSGVLMKGKTLIACPGGRKNYSVDKRISEIYTHAFYLCTSLQTLEFTGTCTLTSIPESAFYGCVSLRTLQLPGGLSSIDGSAFNGCSGLKNVSFGDFSRIKTLGDSCFSGCTSLELIDFGSASVLQSVGSSAFAGCKELKLKGKRIPDSVLKIGPNCFDGCKSLELVALPANITEIGSSAFRGCSKFRSVRLPSSLRVLGSSSFADCSELYNVRYCSLHPPSEEGSNIFSGSPVSTVKVPVLFHGSSFGGLPVDKALDSDCEMPTGAFTPAPAEGCLFGAILQCAAVTDNESMLE